MIASAPKRPTRSPAGAEMVPLRTGLISVGHNDQSHQLAPLAIAPESKTLFRDSVRLDSTFLIGLAGSEDARKGRKVPP